MSERDRAWRRRKTRVLSHREEEQFRPSTDSSAHPMRDYKQHQPGKLSPVQDMRQTWHLKDDAEDAFVSDPVIDPSTPI